MKFDQRRIPHSLLEKKVHKVARIDNLTENFLDDLVGIEFEIEGLGCHDKAIRVSSHPEWIIHQDPSLRGEAIELVSVPLTRDKISYALDLFKDQFGTFNKKLSHRCSVHVHLNVSQLTVAQLWNFLTLLTLFEESFMVKAGDKGRLGNQFCLRVSDSEAIIEEWKKFFIPHAGVLSAKNIGRYANINIQSIYKYGTVEIRGHRGSTDSDEVKKYVDFLLGLLDASRNFNTPREIVETYSDLGSQDFLTSQVPVFKEYLGEYADYEEKLEESLDYAQSVAYFLIPSDQKEVRSTKKLKMKRHAAEDLAFRVLNDAEWRVR